MAGAATALLLARAGHDVLVLDRSRFPSDTLSTHGLARGGVVQLARWGLLDAVLATGAPAVRQVTFGSGGREKTLRIKARAGVDHLVAPRRHVLDTLLLDAAESAGATVRTGATVVGVRRGTDGRVVGVEVRADDGQRMTVAADLVIGADGRRSAMAAWCGAETAHHGGTGATFYTYVGGVPWPAYEFHVAPRAFTGVFPTHDGEACVWLCAPTADVGELRAAGSRRTDVLVAAIDAAAPSLGERIRAGHVTAPVRGEIDLPNYVRQPSGPGWALVGDAGYHRDPVTGHGITDAFRDAELLAEAAGTALRDPSTERDAFADYGRRRDDGLRDTFAITRALAAFPDPERFVELQLRLSEALDREADDLAARPTPARAATVAA